jgi:hypothetical protein
MKFSKQKNVGATARTCPKEKEWRKRMETKADLLNNDDLQPLRFEEVPPRFSHQIVKYQASPSRREQDATARTSWS